MSKASNRGLTQTDLNRIRKAARGGCCNRESVMQGFEGPKSVKCMSCGSVFHTEKRSSTRSYCSDCKRQSRRETKIVWCVACGETLEIGPDSGRSACDSCMNHKQVFPNDGREEQE